MEKYISESEILDRIRRYRESLSDEESVSIKVNVKPMELTERTREKLANQLKAGERRSIRYKEKYEALKLRRKYSLVQS
jgi:hypothetical protein